MFFSRVPVKKCLIAIAIGVFLLYFRRQVLLFAQLSFGGWVIAFILETPCEAFARHMRRPYAVALAFLTGTAAIALVATLIAAPLARQIGELIGALPRAVDALRAQIQQINAWLAQRNLFTFSVPEFNFAQFAGNLNQIMTGTFNFAGAMASILTKAMMMLILSFYFLLDKERFLFKLEMLIPQSARRIALRIACAVKRDLKLYLRGQLIIALLVGALAAIALSMLGLSSSLVLATIVGIFNLIPYFGPILGGIPAVLFALGMGLPTVVKTLAALFAIQQLDGFLFSPRIMGNLTGFTPPVVLLAIALSGSVGGIAGMFFALPSLLIGKICIRVFANRNQVIEKETEV
jgi:predicted PurR-regulated permease PerM